MHSLRVLVQLLKPKHEYHFEFAVRTREAMAESIWPRRDLFSSNWRLTMNWNSMTQLIIVESFCVYVDFALMLLIIWPTTRTDAGR